jgi:hypothetical protein
MARCVGLTAEGMATIISLRMQPMDRPAGPRARQGPGWRAGLGLGALVLLAHLALLQDLAFVGLPGPQITRFDTRVIEAVPPALNAVTAAPRATPVRPRQVPAQAAIAPALATPAADAAVPETAPEAAPAMAAAPPPEPTPPSPPQPTPAAVTPPAEAAPPTSNPVTAQASPPPAPTPAPEPAAPIRPPRETTLTVGAVVLPASVRLRYQVAANKFPFSLNAELLWRQDGAQYDARLSMGAFGQSRVQTSRGEIGPQGLLPTRFSDKYRSEVAAHFERDKGRISFSANTPDVPLLAGAQDYLSVMLQLAAMMAGEPERYPVATTLTMQIAGPRDAEVWLFTVERPETLALPGGEQKTIKLLRHPRRPFDQQVELWFAPALAYLPVRLRISEANGDYLDQKWVSSEAPS